MTHDDILYQFLEELSICPNSRRSTGTDGSELWKDISDQLHRDDGPAVIETDGTQHWFHHGILHRKDGPAVVYPDGTQYWYQDNCLHREDGPAIYYTGSGIHSWYIRHVPVRSTNHFQELTGISDEALTLLILKYGDIR